MVSRENIFSKATNLEELERMLIDAEKEGYDIDTIEKDYIERRNELLGVQEVHRTKGTGKSTRRKNRMSPPEIMKLAWVAGNKEVPHFVPDFSTGNYKAVPQDMIRITDVSSGAFFRDYAPYIKNDTLYIRELNKQRDLIELEQDMEIRLEEGEELQLKNAFYVSAFDTAVRQGSNSYTVVQTMLLNPQNKHIRWKMISMFAIHDGILEQLKFKAD